MEIKSRENETFKNLLSLIQKKGRRETGLCIIEGEKLIAERVKEAQQIFVRKSKANATHIKNGAIILDDKLFNLVTDLETDQGVLAVIAIPKSKEITYPFLVLDRIQDAGNMGTILRTAAAFGFRNIFCIGCVDVWSRKVLRSGMGMQFDLNIIETNFEGFKAFPRGLLIAADLGKENINEAIAEAGKTGGKFGIVLGNEGRGISEEFKKLVDITTTIPMDKKCESLNVSVAAGILMYEMRVRR